MKFHIVIAMYNVAPWIKNNIDIIRKQSYWDFQCILIDDMSIDNTVEIAQETIRDDPRFKLAINKEKKFKTRNVVEGIEQCAPAPNDVIVLIDGDDRLAHRDVLSRIADAYQTHECWLTYGSYCDQRGARDGVSRPYNGKTVTQNKFRKTKWLASHLKTFKYNLWQQLEMDIFQISEKEFKQALRRALFKGHIRAWHNWNKIEREDLLDSSGKYIRRCDDKAFSYPMLEMAGEKATFIEDILYIYGFGGRQHNQPEPVYGHNNNEKWHTRLIRDIVMHKPRYQRLQKNNPVMEPSQAMELGEIYHSMHR